MQKYILLECLKARDFQISREKLAAFYVGRMKAPRQNMQQKIITQSLESLINRGVLVGYGKRTPHKWFMTAIGLTDFGVKEARKILGEQLRLKFK
jgi:hypothetical protein